MSWRSPWASVALAVATSGSSGCDFSHGLEVCTEELRCPCFSDRAGDIQLKGPRPYQQRAQSPFSPDASSEFFFEDFETYVADGVVPILPHATTNGRIRAHKEIVDSVDSDDGLVDGRCQRADAGPDAGWCVSFVNAQGGPGVSIEFDPDHLPQFAGLAWTDGNGFVAFEAFGAGGCLIGKLGPFSPDGGFVMPKYHTGQTMEDQLFWAVDVEGISKIHLWGGNDGAIETDHLQYGRFAP
jgi:hypothetical protein